MVAIVDPLQHNDPLVDGQGRPTPQFMRKWQALRSVISGLEAPAAPSAEEDGAGAHDAGDITKGTLSDDRLSSNIPRKNANNVFSRSNTFREIQAGGDGMYDVGAAGARFRKGWLYDLDLAGALDVAGAASVATTLGVGGNVTLSAALSVAGAATLGSTLAVAGAVDINSTLDVLGASVMRAGLSMTDTRITNLAYPDPKIGHHAANVVWVKDYVRDIASTKTTYSDLWDEMIVTGVNMEMRDKLGNRVSASDDISFVSTDNAKVIHVFSGIAYVEGRRCMVNAADIEAENFGAGEFILYFNAPRVGDPAQDESSENYYADVTFVGVGTYQYDPKNHERAIGKFTVDDGGGQIGAQFFSHYAWGQGVSGKTFTDGGLVVRTLHDPHGAKLFATINGSYSKRLVAYRANQFSLYPALSGLDLGTPAGGSANTPDGLEWSFIYGKSGRFSSSLQVGGKNVSLAGHTHNYLPLSGGTLSGDLTVSGDKRVIGGFGAKETGGVLDWNDPTNARGGSGHTLLMGSAANGPGPGYYFHPFSFEYGATGNMIQFAFPYNNAHSDTRAVSYRSKYGSTWSPWTDLATRSWVGANYQPVNSYLDRVVAPVSYGSIGLTGSTGGYSGIDFKDAGIHFMVRNTDGLSGVYNVSVPGWKWYFDATGKLTVGTVPAARVAAGTFGSGNFGFPGAVEVAGLTTLKGGTVNQYGHNLRPVIVSSTAPSTTAEEGTIWIQI